MNRIKCPKEGGSQLLASSDQLIKKWTLSSTKGIFRLYSDVITTPPTHPPKLWSPPASTQPIKYTITAGLMTHTSCYSNAGLPPREHVMHVKWFSDAHSLSLCLALSFKYRRAQRMKWLCRTETVNWSWCLWSSTHCITGPAVGFSWSHTNPPNDFSVLPLVKYIESSGKVQSITLDFTWKHDGWLWFSVRLR